MQQNTGGWRALRPGRLRLGLTLRDLAQRCADAGAPVDYSQLARIERGEVQNPRPRLRAALAEILDLDPLQVGATSDEGGGTSAETADGAVPEVRDAERSAGTEDVPELRSGAVGRSA